jgi:hypothetical protein
LNTVRIRTGNQSVGINRMPGEDKALNKEILQDREDIHKSHRNLSGIQEASARAKVAIENRRGNCTEHAAIAFDYLRDEKKVRGIAWIGFPALNHMFVVLGLTQEPAIREITRHGQGVPPSWKGTTVVCDPWAREFFLAQTHWDARVPRILEAANGNPVVVGGRCSIECRAYF